MINTISRLVARWLLNTGAISSDDVPLYEYAVYSLIFNLIPIGLAVVIGAVLHMIPEGLLMVMPFILIRKFSGGFHLKSSASCFISSTLFLTLAMLLVRYVIAGSHFVIFTAAAALSLLLIFFLSPIDSDSRKLSAGEIRAFRRIARVIASAMFLIYITLLLFHAPRFAMPVGGGIVITAVLQLPCLLLKLKAQSTNS